MSPNRAVRHSIVVKRTARYFVLKSSVRPQSIWIVLHGYGQLASSFIEDFEPIDDGRRTIVAPEGLSRFYIRAGQGTIGANWMTKEDREYEIEDYVAYLDDVATEVGVEDNSRLFVLGFSQGAATACRWFARSSHSMSGIAIWGGGVPPDLNFHLFTQRLGDHELTFVCGESDIYMSEGRFRAELSKLEELGVPYKPVSFEGGHHIDAALLGEIVRSYEAR